MQGTSSSFMPDVFLPLVMTLYLIVALRKGPRVGVLSKLPIFPSIPSFSSAACVFGIKKAVLIVYGSAGNDGEAELVDATGPTTLSTFSVSWGLAGDYLGVSGCGGIWDGSMVSVSTIRFGVRIPL